MSRFCILLIALLLGLMFPLTAANAFDQTHGRYAQVLQTHGKDGKVDYAGLKANSSELHDWKR